MAIKLTGTDLHGNIVETVVHGPLIYDAQGNLSVDPSTLVTGDHACPTFGCPAITLTQDAEVV
jgi:hypothetical protein